MAFRETTHRSMESLSPLFEKHFQREHIYTRSEISSFLYSLQEAESKNPCNYTYNRWTYGAHRPLPLFEWLERGLYLYLGPQYPFTGDVFYIAQGQEEVFAGYWVEGKFCFSDSSLKDTIDIEAVPFEML